MKMINVEVDIDLSCFDDSELITEMQLRGYSVVEEQNSSNEIIETDIRGCEIKANGQVWQSTGILKITVERE